MDYHPVKIDILSWRCYFCELDLDRDNVLHLQVLKSLLLNVQSVIIL